MRGSRRRAIGVIVMSCVLLLAVGFMSGSCSAGLGGTRGQNAVAPDFSGHTLDGEQVSLSDYQGKIVVLNFMATWCGTCMAEGPEIDQFYRDNKDRVAFLAIAVRDNEESLRSAMAEMGWSFPVMSDGTRTAAAYGVAFIPTTLVIDTEGHIVERLVRSTTAAELSLLVDGIAR